MKCSLELLSEYYDGELVGEEKAAIEAHLTQCPHCSAVLAEYRQISRAVRSLPVQDVPAALEFDLANRLAKGPGRSWWRQLLAPIAELSVVAATAILAIVFVSGLLHGQYLTPRPLITASTPGVGSSDVSLDTIIKLTFDQEMDRSSVEKAISISPSLKVDYLWQGRELSLVPKEPLEPGTTYRVFVDQTAKDGQGRPVSTAFAMEFTTAGSDQAPKPAIAANPTRGPESAPQAAVVEPQSTPVAGAQTTSAPQLSQPVAPKATPPANPAPAQPAATPDSKATPADSAPEPKPTLGRGTTTPTRTPGVMTLLGATPNPLETRTTVVEVGPAFRAVYEQNPELGKRLGKPVERERDVLVAEQGFQGGHMLWLADTKTILVMNTDGTWTRHEDTWTEAEPESMGLQPPPDLYEPIRGFGKVWRENAPVRGALGWGTNRERGYAGATQEFVQGTMTWSDQHVVYVLYADGTWEQFFDPQLD